MTDQRETMEEPFRLEEATIESMQAAIKAGRITCVEIVEHYLARVRAFNGVASRLVTEDGAPVPEAKGTVHGGAPLSFPTQTVKVSDVLPDIDRYKGTPLEYGRMEPTASIDKTGRLTRQRLCSGFMGDGIRSGWTGRSPQHRRHSGASRNPGRHGTACMLGPGPRLSPG